MLDIENISFSFANTSVLDNLSLSLKQGEIGTIIGSSGSGKTTLFKLLTGLLSPSKGTILIGGKPIKDDAAYRLVAYMTQDDLMLPWRTVLNNLMLVNELGSEHMAANVFCKEARYYLTEMGLAEWGNAYPHELSGGMRQRVSLARALIQKCPLLLLDEPFASLDISLREQMYPLLQDIRQKFGTTMLMVTHDFRDALSLSDRIFFLDRGCIIQEWKITPEQRESPLTMAQIHNEMYLRICKK